MNSENPQPKKKLVLENAKINKETYDGLTSGQKCFWHLADSFLGFLDLPGERILQYLGCGGLTVASIFFIGTIANEDLSKYATPENLSGFEELFKASLAVFATGKLTEVAKRLKK